MAWSKLNDSEPELYYHSTAKTDRGITNAIKVVFDRMLVRRQADKSETAQALLFRINATNGYIAIYWYSPEKDQFIGEWKYELIIKKLWEASLEHEEGAFFFDETCHSALYDFMDNYIYDEDGNTELRVFTKYETDRLKEFKIY